MKKIFPLVLSVQLLAPFAMGTEPPEGTKEIIKKRIGSLPRIELPNRSILLHYEKKTLEQFNIPALKPPATKHFEDFNAELRALGPKASEIQRLLEQDSPNIPEIEGKFLEYARRQNILSKKAMGTQEILQMYLETLTDNLTEEIKNAKDVAALKDALQKVRLTDDLKDLASDVGNLPLRLKVIETELDKGVLAAYLKTKMERLLTEPAFCNAAKACQGGEAAKSHKKPELDSMFQPKKSH